MLTTLALFALAHAEPAPTPSQDALYTALRVRHAPPTCTALSDLSETLVEDLVWLVDNATQPPWVGLRAAQCLLIEHPEAAQPSFEGWLSTEGHRGLAILVSQRIDEIPLPIAQALATVALAGPEEETVRPRLDHCGVPQIQELATR